jgi:hypothetical protein
MGVWTHSYITALMMATAMGPETLASFNELTWLIVSGFINA